MLIDEKHVNDEEAFSGPHLSRQAFLMGTACAGLACALGASDACFASAAQGETESPDDGAVVADVVVVGAGAAGLAAASAAAEEGKSVVVLESAGVAGGATLRSSGFMMFVDDDYNAGLERNDAELDQYLALDPADFPGAWADDFAALQEQVRAYLDNGEELGRFDSIECAMVDHYRTGSGFDAEGNAVHLDHDLLRAAFDASKETLEWLAEDGFAMTGKFVASRAAVPPVSHAGIPEGGSMALVDALESKALRLGCEICYDTKVVGLIVEDGRVAGVRVIGEQGDPVLYRASQGVVLATGGFSANGALISMFQNRGSGLSADCGSTNPSTCDGSGLIMAHRAGAGLRDMQFVTTMIRPYHVGGTTPEGNAVMDASQMIVNSQAQRFADETKPTFQNALIDQPDALGIALGDAAMIDSLEEATPGCIEDFKGRGWLFVADTLEELAEAAGLDAQALAQSVETYADVVQAGTDEVYGRTEFKGAVANPPFVAAKVQSCYHLTFGGLIIDEDAHVIGLNGMPVPGLYAAGSVLSGFEGVVHQTGHCLSYVVYCGRIAGLTR